MLTVKNIYEAIDAFAPFVSQETWDNSGLLVGSMDMPADRILTTLDISATVIEEAKCRGVQLIVSHHPVIFTPLKNILQNSPVYALATNGIAAICVHTPLDIAPEGLNAYAYTKLKLPLELKGNPTVLEPTWTDGRGFGWIADCCTALEPQTLAKRLEEYLGCSSVRYSSVASHRKIRRIGYCSGAGGSMLELAAQQDCDAFITGDIKHDRWYAAEFLGVTLFDCGHFGTEQMAAEILCKKIQEAYENADVFSMPGDMPFRGIAGGVEK